MLFNSYAFILVFLPLCWAGYWLLVKNERTSFAFTFLTIASLGFYAYWSVVHLAVLGGSIVFNYFIASRSVQARNKRWVYFGVCINLLVLGYFKYAIFFAQTVSDVSGHSFDLGQIVLPLGISFFTFHQITYLFDTFNGAVRKVGLRNYALYIAFFPQLIAGPVVRAREFLPQLNAYKGDRYFWRNTAFGLSLFVIGLGKKSILADQFAQYANTVFDSVQSAEAASTLDTWVATLSYTFQLYFDFSGYSDMALGLALMFGFRLPINFSHPTRR